jgi:CBS-domain-containing membrane protein
MTVADFMTSDVATCKTTDSLNRAAQLMWERRCGCVPVLDDNGRVVGMLTDRDLSMAAYTQGRRLDDMPATTAMSHSLQSCLPSASIEEAEDLMMAHAVRRLVVVDADGRLCGIVSVDDLAKGGAEWDRKDAIDLERVALTLGEISRCVSGTDEEVAESELSKTDPSDLGNDSLAALRTLRDEIRVDINLAGKELRDRWQRLEARLHAAETRARNAKRGGARNLAALVDSAKRFRTRIRETTDSPPQSR